MRRSAARQSTAAPPRALRLRLRGDEGSATGAAAARSTVDRGVDGNRRGLGFASSALRILRLRVSRGEPRPVHRMPVSLNGAWISPTMRWKPASRRNAGERGRAKGAGKRRRTRPGRWLTTTTSSDNRTASAMSCAMNSAAFTSCAQGCASIPLMNEPFGALDVLARERMQADLAARDVSFPMSRVPA